MGDSLFPELRTVVKLLTFRASTEELHGLNHRHLAWGLLFTWVVGMGRWWEDPKANLLQYLGIGSVIYVFALALFVWLILWPMGPNNWSYLNVLTFVSLTSPPAILYAIPVRHGLDIHLAQIVRLWLLAIVAGWRVLLFGFYLGRGAGFTGFPRFVAMFFPLVLIVFALTVLNLEKVVFNIMDGVAEVDRTVNDNAYGVLVLITFFSVLLFVPLLISYAFLSVKALRVRFGWSGRPRAVEPSTGSPKAS